MLGFAQPLNLTASPCSALSDMISIIHRVLDILLTIALWRLTLVQYALVQSFARRIISLLPPSMSIALRNPQLCNYAMLFSFQIYANLRKDGKVADQFQAPNFTINDASTPELLMIGTTSERWRVSFSTSITSLPIVSSSVPPRPTSSFNSIPRAPTRLCPLQPI